MSDNFIVILPSDACMDSYPLNVVQRFRVNLASRMDFDENWCVALQSVIYPSSSTLSSNAVAADIVSSAANSLESNVYAPVTNATENRYSAGIHMWIYSDCVSPILVGDHYHSVLSVCPFSSTGIYSPSNLLYVPVRQGERDSISVWCANHLGEPYPFEKSGRLILILHFKRNL